MMQHDVAFVDSLKIEKQINNIEEDVPPIASNAKMH